MKILVTGGAGFIGSHLCEKLLSQNHKVICLDNFDPYYSYQIKKRNIKNLLNRNDFTLIEEDIRNKKCLEIIFKKQEFDKIVHLAAKVGIRPSLKNPIAYEDVNIRGTLNLLELCKEHEVDNFIFGSSSSIYGIAYKTPFSEKHSTNPISPYGVTKRACELFCYSYAHLYDMNISCLRFFTVYGPRQRPDMAIHKFTRLIDQVKEIQLYGDGSSKRDYTYISDIIDGIVGALNNRCAFKIFNLGNSKAVELRYVISLIENNLDKKATIKLMPDQLGDVPLTCANIAQSQMLLNYNPKVSIENGIKRFIEWYRSV